MTGAEISKLMNDSELKLALSRHARRYSSNVETQEEFIQDAWLRITTHESGLPVKFYAEQGRKAMEAAYRKEYRRVDRDSALNVNGISVTGKEIKKNDIPSRMIQLTADKYLDPVPETLDWQYYEGQEADMLSGAWHTIAWYFCYPDFENLSRQEQEKIVGKFVNGGYSVGAPIGGTYGNESRHYKTVLYIDPITETVEYISNSGRSKNEWHIPSGLPTDSIYKDCGGPLPNRPKPSLELWHALRRLGGSDDWLEWLDDTIERLEDLIS